MNHEREAHDFRNGGYGDGVGDAADAAGTVEPQPAASDASEGPHAEACDTLALYLREARRHRMTENEAKRCCCMSCGAETETAGARNGKRSARDVFRANHGKVVEGHLDLVVNVARHYEGLGLPLEDLIQEGNLGLLAAVRKFDPERGVPFSRYAVGWIRQAICRAISIKSRTIRIPLDVLGLRRRAASVLCELEQEAHNDSLSSGRYRTPTVEDCARRIGVSTGCLRTTIRRLPDVESFDAPAAPGGPPLVSCLADGEDRSPADCAAADERRSHLDAALGGLPARLQLVIRRHYGLDGNGTASFTEIGRELHLCRERVRQLHTEALARLRRDPQVRASAD